MNALILEPLATELALDATYKAMDKPRPVLHKGRLYNWIDCGSCGGSGYVNEHSSSPCGECQGEGRIQL